MPRSSNTISDKASGGREPPEACSWTRFKCQLISCAAVVLCFTLAAPAHGVVILKKGTTQPLMGYLVRQDATTVVLREVLADGTSREHTILRTQIDELLLPVSAERLAALDPARPQQYREYAEELAEKARDPEAREAAIRLFHIAAYSGDDKLRRSALLGLAGLAASPAEERRFRAAAYLYDAEHPPAFIVRRTAVPTARTPAARAELAALLGALRAIRQGRPSETRRFLNDAAVHEPLALLVEIITREQLLALATTKPLADPSLRQLLAAEIALELALAEGEAAAATPAPESTAWSAAASPGGLAPLPSLDLLHLTQFDPRASVFRDGKWVVP
jgi:hypothetical protein